MGLNQYHRKRDFKSTPEPKGKVGKRRGKALRFVVHMHAASRLHFDLRLEMDGVYKSWAVPKGPSLNPSEQRLAIFVEDHPIAYGDFEGIIPKGNYGAGTVMIWDRGTYEERWGKDAQLAENLEAGKITFVMHGEKLQGEFALIRIRDDEKTWLLVKKHDAHANHSRNFVFDECSVMSGRTMAEIKGAADAKWVRGQGRVGLAQEKLVKPPKVASPKPPPLKAKSPPTPAAKAPQTLEAKARSAGAKLSKRPAPSALAPGPWIFEEAWEGYAAKAEVAGRTVTLTSRNGIAFSDTFRPIVTALRALGQKAVFEGTIMVRDQEGLNHRAALSQFMQHGKGELLFVVSDVLAVNGEDWRGKPLQERKEQLQKLLGKARKPLVLARHHVGHETTAWQALGLASPQVLARPQFSTYRQGLSQRRLLTIGDTPAPVPATTTSRQPRAASSPPPVKGPVLTNLKKIYWPDEGYTKGDLLVYYEAMAAIILPHLRDRPLSLNRYPNGIAQPGFYQKDLTGHVPRWLERQRLYSPSVDRSIDYALCQNRESLLYLANLGCIEFHPWLARVSDLENPDFCLIDLDPDGHDYADVIKAALAVRAICEDLGIPLYPKTSGASGMHLCIPLGARYTFDESRDLAVAIAERVHARLPDLTSLKRNPGLRRGKIYLDCFQNRRGQTIAAPYCVRPLAGAPVSTPLRWSEVKSGLTPGQFTMQNTRRRLDKVGDIWLPATAPGIDLAACLRALEKTGRDETPPSSSRPRASRSPAGATRNRRERKSS